MYLIAILMTALLMGRGGLSQRVDYSQAPSHDRLSDYPELQGIVHSLLHEDSEKCADVSVDCSDFPATVCEGDAKEVDFHLPDSYCQKVICCTKEIAREKIVFTGSQSMENRLRKSELMKWANAEKRRMEAKGVWYDEPPRKLPQPTRKSSRGRPHSKKTTVAGTNNNGGGRHVLDETAARDFLIKARQRIQQMKTDMEKNYLRRQREPQDLQLRSSDQIAKATTVQPLTEVEVIGKDTPFRKRKPTSSQGRRLEVTTETPVSQAISPKVFPIDTSLEKMNQFSTRKPKSKKKQSQKPQRAENNPFTMEDIMFRDMKPLPTEASQDNQSKSTTVIRDFTTPRSFPEMWHERGLAETTKGPAPEESKQRYDVQQNFLELCGSIAAHADNNMNASSQGIVQGSDEQDLKANGAGCYEDFVKPARRGKTQGSKTPTRKLVKSSAPGRGGPNEENLYKPQKWQRPNPLLGAAGPQTPLPPKQRQRLPVSPYSGTPRYPGGSSYSGSSFPGGASYPGSSFSGGASYPGSSYSGGASYPGSSIPGGSYPGSSIPGGSYPGSSIPGGSYPGSSLPGGSYPGAPYPPGPFPHSGASYPGSYPYSGSPFPVSPYLPNHSAKKPASQHRPRPIYPVETDSEEDSTEEDDCDGDDGTGGTGGQPDFESQLNTYFDPPDRDEIVGAVRSYGVGNPIGNSYNDDGDYDGQHFGPKGTYGYGKYPGMGAGRYPVGGANRNRDKPPSIYVSKVVKPSRGREVSVPGHTLRELKIFGQFKNGGGELCDEASENEEVQKNPTARPAVKDKKTSENLLEDSEETKSSKKVKGRERRRLDQDETSSKETEFST